MQGPRLLNMARAYITQQGQAWDEIARDVYGNEKLSHILLEANPEHREALLLSGNIELTIPDIDIKDQSFILPPWEREDA